MCRELPSARLTTLLRHEFYRDYVHNFALRRVEKPGAEATADDALPAALAALLGTLPSAVRKDCADALDGARRRATDSGLDRSTSSSSLQRLEAALLLATSIGR